MEIKVGEYIRTLYNTIEKIKRISKEDGWICVTTDRDAYELEWLKRIKVKHSKNIIDLIEVGDYVNGEKINSFRTYGNKKCAVVENSEDQLEYCFDNEDIKSIVTKERFESIEYKV